MRIVVLMVGSLLLTGMLALQPAGPAGAEDPKIEVTLTSDFKTWVSITSVRTPQKFHEVSVMLAPRDYEVIGRRKGYQEVRKQLKVEVGSRPIKVHVACTMIEEERRGP